ncbi:MAG TPA: pirin family protein [Polyangiales bacterium]|nr:pirin family protein [Polyangiales bacterium]
MTTPAVELVLHSRPRDLGGGFVVGRILPAAQRRLVGPFIFFDHMGPVNMPPQAGIDVRPHPHIGLATVTYLFDGEIFHRDSLGFAQAIRPGDVNWMIAGRGIVHSERTAPEPRRSGQFVHGIQAWVALPREQEEREPGFFHHPVHTLPAIARSGVSLRLIAGSAFDATSPVAVSSPTFYVDAAFEAGASLALPDEHEERACYVVSGELRCEGVLYPERSLLILRPGAPVTVQAERAARVMLLGGAKLEGERHIYWNFVSSSEDRIERAKADWKERKFPLVPGDEVEFTPLPET